MQKHIVFPTDFSETAHNAFAYALDFAARFDAKITLIHAQYESPVAAEYIPKEFVAALKERRVAEAEQMLHHYQMEAQQSKKGRLIPVDSKILSGKAVQAIVKFCQEEKPDFLIMGTDGANSLSYSIQGSVTTEVISKTTVPVLAIPHSAKFTPIHEILYALDPSEIDYALVDKLYQIAQSIGAKLTCLYVAQDPEDERSKRLAVNERLFLLEQSGRLKINVVQDSDVLDGVHKFLNNEEADLLAMTTHKRDVIQRITEKSLTQEMVLYSHIPVLVFHERIMEAIP